MNKLNAIASRRLANHRGIIMIRATSQKGSAARRFQSVVERQAQDKGTRQTFDRVAQKRALRVRIMSPSSAAIDDVSASPDPTGAEQQ